MRLFLCDLFACAIVGSLAYRAERTIAPVANKNRLPSF